MSNKINIAVLGASGYTGADIIRIAMGHPFVDIKLLCANTHAGKEIAEVFPHLEYYDLPKLIKVEDANWKGINLVFCCLPHATSQKVISNLPNSLKIIDLSADFRLRDTDVYKTTYGNEHTAIKLQTEAVYGLSEHYREEIKYARLVACPGCYPTATLIMLLPLIKMGLITDLFNMIIDAKSGVSGAGRTLKQNLLFCEADEGLSPYAIGSHRHAPEIEQEINKALNDNNSESANRNGDVVDDIKVSFTPHLIPMSRGELVTIYARAAKGLSALDIREKLQSYYKDDSFIKIAKKGQSIGTQHVMGSNFCKLAVYQDRIDDERVILVATIDNLVKGSSGQAIQNMNIMYGFDENCGLLQAPLFP